jgi:hypothetical protein
MTWASLGLYLWLFVYPMGQPMNETTIFDRTWWKFDSMSDCEEWADNSDWIYRWLYNHPDYDWIFAMCFDAENKGERTYILPVYNVGTGEDAFDKPNEALDFIEEFERAMVTVVIPNALNIPTNQVPKKKIIIKSNLNY